MRHLNGHAIAVGAVAFDTARRFSGSRVGPGCGPPGLRAALSALPATGQA